MIYKNTFTGLFRKFKDQKGYASKNGMFWSPNGSSEQSVKSLPYYKVLDVEKYNKAWTHALEYCRMYNICSSTKKWLPWEKKFFGHIYELQLKRI